MPGHAVLYLCHTVNATLYRGYEDLRKECSTLADCYYVLNLSSDSVPPNAKGVYPITPAHRDALGHPSRQGNVGWWVECGPSHARDIQSGFDQALLAFRQLKPEYDYYWIVEYDVEFSGPWSKFFESFVANTSDLLCTNLHRRKTNPAWAWWKSLIWPHESKPEPIRGFFPIARLSGRAIDALIAAGRGGVDGFYEVVWPTVISHRGFVIEDIGGDGEFVRPGNINRWYTSSLESHNLSPGTFVFRPIRFRPGRSPDKLWHPIKRRFVRHILGKLIDRVFLRARGRSHAACRISSIHFVANQAAS
jgi:hypothetical protein